MDSSGYGCRVVTPDPGIAWSDPGAEAGFFERVGQTIYEFSSVNRP